MPLSNIPTDFGLPSTTCIGVNEKEISLLVASVDLDHDGTLTFIEFSKVMFDAQSNKV